MKKDIETRDDLRKLATTFYEQLLKDETFNHIFLEVAQIDVLKHIDVFVDFWESALFQAGKYKGDLLSKHLEVHQAYHYGLTADHFKQWLNTFNATVNDLFEGEKAEAAKQRALSIAGIIKAKINYLDQLRLEVNN